MVAQQSVGGRPSGQPGPAHRSLTRHTLKPGEAMSALQAKWIGVLFVSLILPAGCRPSGGAGGGGAGVNTGGTGGSTAPQPPDWTVLVFLNADNNLEKDSLTD